MCCWNIQGIKWSSAQAWSTQLVSLIGNAKRIDSCYPCFFCRNSGRRATTELSVDKITNLIKSLLLQTDDVEVKIGPQAIGPVEIDSASEAIPVRLVRKVNGQSRKTKTKNLIYTVKENCYNCAIFVFGNAICTRIQVSEPTWKTEHC